MGFLTHWESESVTDKIIQLSCNKNFPQEAIVHVYSCYKNTKSTYLFSSGRKILIQIFGGIKRAAE